LDGTKFPPTEYRPTFKLAIIEVLKWVAKNHQM